MKVRVTREEWYRRGGFMNPHCFRHMRGRQWVYFIEV
jgi:hypothetical protein